MIFQEKFIEDATELLIKLEQTILELEQNQTNSKFIEEIFRGMHTLKGTAGMYGFDEMGKLTHRLENIYDLLRNGRMPISKEILDLTLKSVDLLNKSLKTSTEIDYTDDYLSKYEHINKILNKATINVFDGDQREIDDISAQTTGMRTWLIVVKPTENFKKRGIKMHVVFNELTEAGEIQIFNRYEKQSQGAGVYWEIILASKLPHIEIDDILMFINDITEVHQIAEENIFLIETFAAKIEEMSIKNSINKEDLVLFIEQTKANEDTKKTIPKIESRITENIKVSAEKLDEQMILLSELVTTKAEIQLLVQQMGYKNLTKVTEKLEKITRRFRKNIFKIRLIPLGTLQLRFDRLIRDLSTQLGKNVELKTEGMHTELDKTIIDSLESPLMHLVRNCLDHGIEAPEIRKMRNKPGKGTIWLTARQAATNVFITVRDDGEGINTEQIIKKAIQKGIIHKSEKLTQTEIHKLIFKAGFSTAQNLTEISGRGVGMDVVRQTINSLRGTIEINSTKGEGASFTIKLPLTLSIIDTMLVRVESMFYSIPLAAIIKCTEIKTIELDASDNEHIKIKNELLPYLIVSKRLNIEHNKNTTKPENMKIVVVHNASKKIALVVDEVIGEHQAVLKPLGEYFKEQQYLSGATQLADGSIALVLDVMRLQPEKQI